MKKRWILFAVVLMILQLTGCSGTAGDSSGNSSLQSEPSTVSSSSAADGTAASSPAEKDFSSGFNERKIDLESSPDLSMEVYASNSDNGSALVLVKDGRETVLYRCEAGHRVYRPHWSPDGTMIAFMERATSSIDICDAQVSVCTVATGAIRPTGKTVTWDRYFINSRYYSWSSDSGKLLIESVPIFYWDVKTGVTVQVSRDFGANDSVEYGEKALRPAFSRDGSKIAYTVLEEGKLLFKVYDCESKTASDLGQVTISGVGGFIGVDAPVWLSDHEYLCWKVLSGTYLKVDITAKTVTPYLDYAANVSVSPDGKYLSCWNADAVKGPMKTILMELSTGKRTVIDEEQQFIVWSAVSDRVISYNIDGFQVYGVDGTKQGAGYSGLIGDSVPAFTNDGVWYEPK